MNINNDEDLNSVKKVEPQENNKKPILGGDNE